MTPTPDPEDSAGPVVSERKKGLRHDTPTWITAGFHSLPIDLSDHACGHSWELHRNGECEGLSGGFDDDWYPCVCTTERPST